MSQFQLVVIGIMMGLALIGVLLISGIIPGFKPGPGDGTPVPIVVWGAEPYEKINGLFTDITEQNKSFFTLEYVQKNSATYENELVDALASGKGPNIWLLNQDFILKDKAKIVQIPFASFPERSFKDTFIQEGELFLSSNGIIALPFIIDPMVLYWNRDLFANAGISKAPKTWDEFVNFAEKLTIRDKSGNISQAGAALGDFKNIDYAEDIISFLIMQTGNAIVDPITLRSVLGESSSNFAVNPVESAIRFFTEFSDPNKTTYSWNRSLPTSKNAFIANILAMYFGYAGEYKEIAEKNSHLNFDVAEVPQVKGGKIHATYGKIQGLAISKSSANTDRAMMAAVALIRKDSIAKLATEMFLPPVRRDLLAEIPQDPASAIFYKSAIQSRGWLKPDPSEVTNIFRSMVEDVITGKKKIYDAVRGVHEKLDKLLELLQAAEKKSEPAPSI